MKVYRTKQELHAMIKSACFAAFAVLAWAAEASAQPAHFDFRPVTIPGGSSVVLTAISPNGIVGGIFYYNSNTDGFLLNGTALSVLPGQNQGDYDSVPTPTSILPDGTGLGEYAQNCDEFACDIEGFIWQNGFYTITFDIGQASGAIVRGNTAGAVAYWFDDSGYIASYVGVPPHFSQIERRKWLFPQVASLNSQGDVAGVTGNGAVFVVTGTKYITLNPPGSSGTFGGYINDKRQVAGTFYDQSGAAHAHGFIWADGKYTLFDAPVVANSMTVSGFSNTGYIAGTYGTTTGREYGFLYHNGNFNSFSKHPARDYALSVAGVDDNGHVAINESPPPNGAGGGPYLAVCKGETC